jgi:hypothetical protein
LRPELKNLKPPTLFIYGDKGIEGPPSLAHEMADLAPNARSGTGSMIAFWIDKLLVNVTVMSAVSPRNSVGMSCCVDQLIVGLVCGQARCTKTNAVPRISRQQKSACA